MNSLHIQSTFNYLPATKPLVANQWKGVNLIFRVPATKLFNQHTNLNITLLPFLVRIRFVKTLRDVIPQIYYQYIQPNRRPWAYLAYTQKLVKHKSNESVSVNWLYSAALKI